jgi:hypothetical protein
MKKKEILLVTMIIFFGCGTKTEKRNEETNIQKEIPTKLKVKDDISFFIDVERDFNKKKDFKLSDIAFDIKYVPLETNNKCLLSGNLKFLFFKENIFIRDNKALYQFSNTGKFIRKIGKNGNGPGEYGNVFGFTVLPDKNEILLVAYPSKKILVYNIESGEFKRSFSVKFRNFSSIIEFPNNQITFHIANAAPNSNDMNENRLYFTDSNGISLDSIPSSGIRKEGNIAGDLISMYKSTNNLFYMTFLTDTLYLVSEDKQRKPYAIFNMGKFKTDPEIKLTPELLETDKHKLMPVQLEETPSYFFITFMKGFKSEQLLYGIYNKNENNLNFIEYGKEGIQNDLDSGLPFWPKHVINNSTLVSYLDAYKIIEFKQTPTNAQTAFCKLERIEKIKENDNPVLMLVKLKE